MAILKCPMCGGEIEIDTQLSVGRCIYCDSKIIIPKNLEKIGNLYNRAIFFRRLNEFDKAIEMYEEILKEDNENAEAHYGLALSRYGIEYIEEPETGERKPTCHRTKTESILSDPDYLKALECADFQSRSIYQHECERIAEIQKKILELAGREEKYDVFICYKETDDFDKRTEDSVLAQELYYELKKKNYKIFFAKKTLENKLGEEYEPIIFSALNSAKVLLVVGTSIENFNAVWVRNEWSRFLELRKINTEKKIIPCYKGITPYELPQELVNFQALDMEKIGFVQDLCDGIDKVLHDDIDKGSRKLRENANNEADCLWENIKVFYKLGDKDSAQSRCQEMIDKYPGDYRGWYGKAMVLSDNFTNRQPLGNSKTIDLCLSSANKVANEGEREKIALQTDEYHTYIKEYIKEKEKQMEENEKRRLEKAEKIVQLTNEIALLKKESHNNKCPVSPAIFPKTFVIITIIMSIAFVYGGVGECSMLFIVPCLIAVGRYVYIKNKTDEYESKRKEYTARIKEKDNQIKELRREIEHR